MGDLSLLADRHPIRPITQANLRYAEALTRTSPGAAADRREPGDLPRPRRARLLRAQQVAVRLRGRPRVDPRPAAQRDQQAQEPALRVAGRGRIDRFDARSGSRARAAVDDRFPGGVFTSKGGEYVWIAALPPGGLFVEHAGEGLFNAAHRLIAAGSAQPLPPRDARRGGGADRRPRSQRGTRSSATSSGSRVTCLIIVAISIGLYFRRLRAIPLTGIPAVHRHHRRLRDRRELAFGYLNSSTAFLGSIIVGNGINYAIVLMSRYEEQRARGVASPRGAPRRAGRGLARDAGGGDRRVGRVRVADGDQLPRLLSVRRDGRGRGAVSAGSRPSRSCRRCWSLLDRRRAAPNARRRARRWSSAALAAFLQRLRGGDLASGRRPQHRGALVGLRHFLKDPFEYDFRKLNAKLDTHRGGAAVRQEPRQRCSGAGRRRPSCSPTRSMRSSRSRRRSGART